MTTLDTRDLEERKQELEGFRDSLHEALLTLQKAQKELEQHNAEKPSENEEAVRYAESDVASCELDFSDEERKELEELEELESNISDWKHGETMILECDFEDYARELADDIGAVPDELTWPCNCIDWKQAAKELAYDYTTVTYQGQDYLVRA